MTKLTGATMDIAKENIEQLKRIFPDVFTEGKVDYDKLRQVLGEYVEESTENYSFTWNGKGQALKLAQTPTAGTLRPCKEDSKNWDSTKNLYIEGDNLEVLKLLQKSYFGKVKMIYIDPPYNTGKDFVYKDDFRDSIQNYKEITGQVDGEGKRVSTNAETSGRYHTDWLNMMYPRLRLARNLLTEDGVIFISIDDNEVTNLRKICDEIFGEDNFVAQIILENDPRARPYGAIATTHEYIVIYFKNAENELYQLVDNNKKFDYQDENGGFDLYELRNRNIAFNVNNRPNLFYPFYLNPSNHDENGLYQIDLEYHSDWIEVFPVKSNNVQTVWRWGKEKAKANLNSILFGKKNSSNGFQIVKKYREKTYSIHTVLNEKIYYTDRGTLELKSIFSNKLFDFPKTINLLNLLLKLSSKSNDIILDFFSGSATTAHAVMQLNAEDGGKRQYIMVQLPELTEESSETYKAGYKNICEIGKERIRRAGEKIKEEKGMLADDLDIGFKVFKLDTSNILQWQPKEEKQDIEELKRQLMAMGQVITTGRTDLDVVYEIMLKMGLDLTYPVEELTFADKKVYSVGAGALLICLADSVPLEIAEEMLKYKDINPELTRIVFSDKSFKNDSTKISVKERFTQAGFNQNAFMTI